MMWQKLIRPGLVLAAALMVSPGVSRAEPAGLALVIGNSTYTGLQPIPGCSLSARSVGTVLKAQAYEVQERYDPSAGQLSSAIAALTRTLEANPNLPLLVYICGYAAGVNGRPFLLPIAAAPQQASDVLSQGMLAKSFLNAIAPADTRAALFIFDAVPTPGLTDPLGFGSLATIELPSKVGLFGATDLSADGPTPLIGVLVPRLKENPAIVSALIERAVKDLSGLRSTTVELRKLPADVGYLIGAPPPPPPPPPPVEVQPAPPPPAEVVVPPPPPVQAPPPVVVAAPAPPVPAVAPSPAANLPVVPDEARMTDADRRLVQTALAKMGYYDAKIDGVFGAETRAAIRRLQHELKAPLTGFITAEQARGLFARQ